MSKATYWQKGDTLDFKNETGDLIEANTIIVVGKKVGIAGTNIQNGETGSIHMSGVFEMPKNSESEIKIGTPVYYDGAGITESEDNGKTEGEKVVYTPAGYAAGTSAAASDTILVKLQG